MTLNFLELTRLVIIEVVILKWLYGLVHFVTPLVGETGRELAIVKNDNVRSMWYLDYCERTYRRWSEIGDDGMVLSRWREEIS